MAIRAVLHLRACSSLLALCLTVGQHKACAAETSHQRSELNQSADKPQANQKDNDTELIDCLASIKASPEDSTLRFRLGSLYERQGKVKEAISAFREALRLNPNDTRSLEEIVIIYGARNDWPNASACAAHWIELEPDNPHARFLKGWFELADRDLRDARDDLEDALKLAPADPEIINAYALALTELGKFDQAEKAYKSVLAANRDHLPARLNLTILYLQSGRLTEAKDLIKPVRALEPDQPPVLATSALVNAADGEMKTALSQAQQALKNNSKDALARVALARVLKSTGDRAGQLAELRQACADEPRSIFVMNELSEALIDQGQYVEAAKIAQQGLQLAPSNSTSKKLLASALSKQGNWDGAVLLLQEVAARNPKNSALRCELAYAQEMKGDLGGAEISYQSALRVKPEELDALCGLTRISLAQKDVKGALKTAEAAVSLAPSSSTAHSLLGEALYDKGKFEPSLEECKYVLALDPHNEAALCLKGKNLFQQRDWTESILYLQKCVSSAHASADHWLMLAAAQKYSKDLEGSRLTLKSAAAAFPKDSKISAALDRLSRRSR